MHPRGGAAKGRIVSKPKQYSPITHDEMRKYIDGKRGAVDELARARQRIAELEGEIAKARAAITTNEERAAIFVLIDAERKRQTAKWGEQDHPMLRLAARRAFVSYDTAANTVMLPTAERARKMCEHEHKNGDGTYVSIALEEFAEFFEACYFHGELSDKAYDELIQTTAVFVQMAETLKRKRERR